MEVRLEDLPGSGSLCLVFLSIIFIKVGNLVVMVDIFEPEPVFSNLSLDDGCLDDVSFIETVQDVAAGIKLGDTNIKTPGRILGRIEAYIDSGASEYVVETVRVGYKLVFEGGVPPPPSFKNNNRSALQKPDFTYNELLRLESLGCIKRVTEQPHVVNPLSVVFSKKWRCVLDASQHLNSHCQARPTKLDDLSNIPFLIKQNDFMTVNDLDSGYWQVPIHPDHQTYLGLSFEHSDGRTDYWVWVVMPLGIRDAAHIFTALTSPLIGHLASEGHRCQIYIDDLIAFAASFSQGVIQDEAIQNWFLRGGWVFKPEKSSGPPSQRVKYLGLIIDSVSMTFEIPTDKLEHLISFGSEILSMRRVGVKTLASWVGSLQACRLAIGPLVSIMCRSLYDDIKQARTWSSFIKLSNSSSVALRWWIANLPKYSSYPIMQDPSITVFDYKLASDASDRGCFVYRIGSSNRLFSRPFTAAESRESSTYKELSAIHGVWTDPVILEEFRGKTVGHYTDSKSTVAILGGGSRNTKLQKLVVEIVLSLVAYNIRLCPVWITRDSEIIQWADSGSRDFRSDDYSLDNDSFVMLESVFGKFTIDCMANAANSVTGKFFSRYSSVGTSGVNFFAQQLTQEDFYYCFPPVRRAVDALRHLANFGASGVIVIPVWFRASFFHWFFPDGVHAATWCFKLVKFSPTFTSSLYVGPVFKGKKDFDTVALQFSFKVCPLERESNTHRDFCLRGGCNVCL